ncbi:hypothetical protein ACFL5G_01065 [Candidatus Margulisiibacteriota bacterium]
MLNKIIAYTVWLAKHSPKVLGLVEIYPALARHTIEQYHLTGIGPFIRNTLPDLSSRLRSKEKTLRWTKIEPQIKAILINLEKRSYKVFEFLAEVEKHRTTGRSYNTNVSTSPFYPNVSHCSDAMQIIRELIGRTTSTDKALKHWQNWLHTLALDLHMTGARTLSGYKVYRNRSDILSLPSTSWKKVKKGKYEKTSVRLHTSKYQLIRQQAHELESIVSYGRQLKSVLTYFENRLADIENNDFFTKNNLLNFSTHLKKYITILAQRKTTAQTNLRARISNILADTTKLQQISVRSKNLSGSKKKLQISLKVILKYLKQRLVELNSQLSRINRRRNVLANSQLKDIEHGLKTLPIPETLQDILNTLEGLQSGYQKNMFLLNSEQKDFSTKINNITKLVSKALPLAKKNECQLLLNEIKLSNKEFLEKHLMKTLTDLISLSGMKNMLKLFQAAIANKKKADLLNSLKALTEFLENISHRNYKPSNALRINKAINYLELFQEKINQYYEVYKQYRNYQQSRLTLKDSIAQITGSIQIAYLNVSLNDPK